MTCPYWSTARYTYRQTPLTFTYVSSTSHLSPGEWRANRGGVGQQRGEPLHPPEDGYVVDLDAALDQ
jgi:hypothetical protein